MGQIKAAAQARRSETNSPRRTSKDVPHSGRKPADNPNHREGFESLLRKAVSEKTEK